MAVVAAIDRCVACNGSFRATSKPLWAFTRDGRLAGRTHTKCESKWSGFVSHSSRSALTAQFWQWTRVFRHAEFTDAEWDALGSLITSPDEPWGEAQEEALRWMADGPIKRQPDEIAAIRVAYHRLIAEFNAWRAAL